MPGLRTLAVLTDLPACVEQDEFCNKTELHADGSNSRSGQLSELPFSNSAFHSPSWPIVIIVKLVLSARLHIAVCNCGERRVLKDARTTARVIQTVLICPYGPLDLSSTPKTGKLARRITRPITGAAWASFFKGCRPIPGTMLATSQLTGPSQSRRLLLFLVRVRRGICSNRSVAWSAPSNRGKATMVPFLVARPIESKSLRDSGAVWLGRSAFPRKEKCLYNPLVAE